MKSIEFYITPNGEVVIQDESNTRQLCQNDSDFNGKFSEMVETFYPDANNALLEAYKASNKNPSYYRFLRVRRFIKCNLSSYDNILDIDHLGRLNFEFVACPMRGECKHEGIICNPKFNSCLSQRELEVMRMCYEGRTDDEIATALFISLNTVNNHRKNSFKKLSIHSMADFIRYANDHKIFKS